MGKFQDFVKKATQPIVPAVQALQAQQAQQQPQQQQMPQVDTSNAINSLFGPTPAEREAQQQQLLKQKRNMIAWTGLFDGLRQLANFYTASQGANNMQFTDNPYQTIEQGYQSELKRQDANQHYANSYAKQMIDYKRQAESDQMKRDMQKAQLKWYDTRDETARLRAENDRLRAEQQRSINEARRKQIELKTKQMEELHPLQKQKLQAMIKNTLHNANRPYSGGKGNSGKGLSTEDPFKELANQLYENPDVIGPILQQQGLGFYDKDSKEFNFSKNATKGMATTATQRANRQRSSSARTNSSNRSGFFNK